MALFLVLFWASVWKGVTSVSDKSGTDQAGTRGREADVHSVVLMLASASCSSHSYFSCFAACNDVRG